MKTDSEIRRYLASVERAVPALPAPQREELMEDLAEHIEVNLAERPGQLPAILAELGDPQEIAATALRENAADADHATPRNPQLVVGALAAGSTLSLVGASVEHSVALTVVAVITLVGAVLALCRSPWWTPARKWTTVGLLLVPNWILHALAHTLPTPSHGTGTVLTLVELAVRAATLIWLWHSRVAPPQGSHGLPPRLALAGWSALAVLAVTAGCILLAT